MLGADSPVWTPAVKAESVKFSVKKVVIDVPAVS